MTPIQVVGIGLDGAAGLSVSLQQLIQRAQILAGSDRHLGYFPDHGGPRWPLQDLGARLRQHLQQPQPALVVILASGDPLFFGLGRQLLLQVPASAITFHPHVSSLQLAFSRIKRPWQDATLVSAHGRSLDALEKCLKTGASPIAVLTDTVHSPGAIARFIQDLALPVAYRLWVCESLGNPQEQVQCLSPEAAQDREFAPLNVVILERLESPPPLEALPLLGIPDSAFLSFPDRPGLMTKREIRVHILAELALQPGQTVWDIGAGTGSVSVEVARLCPTSAVWAIEKTALGSELIQQNARRFGTANLHAVQGQAPASLAPLPAPDRIFVGGSGGQMAEILTCCAQRLLPGGQILIALATLETLSEVTRWAAQHSAWRAKFQQIALSQSAAVGPLNRWVPLNPVTLACLRQAHSGQAIAPPEAADGNSQQQEIQQTG